MQSTKQASSPFAKSVVVIFTILNIVNVIVTSIRLFLLKDTSAFIIYMEIATIILLITSMNTLFIIVAMNLMSMINTHYEVAPYYESLVAKYSKYEKFQLSDCDEQELRTLCKLAKISEEHIQILTMFYLKSMSYDEIATQLNKSYDGVNSAIYRSRKKLTKVTGHDNMYMY